MRRLVGNLVALLAGSVLALGVLEIGLRVHNPFEQRVRFGSVVLPVNRVETVRNDRVPGVPAVVVKRRNSLGFRGPDPPADFPSRLSIVTIGGSTTESSYQPEGDTWTDRLGANLAECFDGVWINNAGLDGHTTFGHLALLRDHVARLHPRVALFAVGINDRWAQAPSTWDREAGTGAIDLASPAALGKSVAARLEIGALAMTVYRALRGWRVGAWYAPVDWASLPEGDPYPGDAAAQMAAIRTTKLPAYEARVDALVDASRTAGIVPVFVTQPIVFGPAIDPTTGKDLRRLQHGAFEWERLEAFNDSLRAVAERRQVPLIDLARRMPHDTALFFDHVHATSRGEERVAAIVSEEARPLLARLFPERVRDECRASLGAPVSARTAPASASR